MITTIGDGAAHVRLYQKRRSYMYIKRPIHKETNTKRDLYMYEKRYVYTETYIFMIFIYIQRPIHIWTKNLVTLNQYHSAPLKQWLLFSSLKTAITAMGVVAAHVPLHQKRPSFMYIIYINKETSIHTWKEIVMWRDPYTKRDLHLCIKRPSFMYRGLFWYKGTCAAPKETSKHKWRSLIYVYKETSIHTWKEIVMWRDQ